MRLRRGGGSGDIENRESEGGSTGGFGGLGGGSGGGLGGGGLGSVLGNLGLLKMGFPGIIILVVLFFISGGSSLLGGGGGGLGIPVAPSQSKVDDINANTVGSSNLPGDVKPGTVEFVTAALDDIQASWDKQFAASGQTYTHAKLQLFRNFVNTGGCGSAQSGTGPFYCPADSRVYLDRGFFDELASKFGAPGDFAQAYVIAHEIGHHVQNLLGISEKVRRLEQQHPSDRNAYSVRLELQADCFAGVWAHAASQETVLDDNGKQVAVLEAGDIDEGLRAAASVGDDYIQKNLGSGRVDPETWTHGSSAQRQKWFKQGYATGNPDTCDTFTGDV